MYLSLGIAEYTRLGEATDKASLALSSLLRTWAPQVTEEEYAEDFFGMGFGTTAFYARRAIELPEYERMTASLPIDSTINALLGRTE